MKSNTDQPGGKGDLAMFELLTAHKVDTGSRRRTRWLTYLTVACIVFVALGIGIIQLGIVQL